MNNWIFSYRFQPKFEEVATWLNEKFQPTHGPTHGFSHVILAFCFLFFAVVRSAPYKAYIGSLPVQWCYLATCGAPVQFLVG